MNIDIAGRVRNTELAYSNCLLPLFEAIINSIHAIEDAKCKSGRIGIFIERDKSQSRLELDQVPQSPIVGFKVEDNGIGFTAENYASFTTADSQLKVDRGGKGIGRFIWLKAFSRVSVESYFKEDGGNQRRTFDFISTTEGIDKHSLMPSEKTQRKTTVRLMGFDGRYEEKCPKSGQTIARAIVEHCLEYFVLAHCPKMTLHDEEEPGAIVLNQVFEEQVKVNSESRSFAIRDVHFDITNVMLYSGANDEHRLYYCAHKRTVQSENLGNRVVDLTSKLRDADGKSFVYAGYVSGEYLDRKVNAERTGFSLARNADLGFPGEVSWGELAEQATASATAYLAPHMDPIRQEKLRRIEQYVQTQAPQYRPILKRKPEALSNIPPHLSDDKLDIELHKIGQAHELDLRQRCHDLLAVDSKGVAEFDKHKEVFERFIEEWNELGKSNLARYIANRAAILSFLEGMLGITPDGKYQLEKSIHSVIFPLGSTSDDVLYDNQNLWVIDERLAYHTYLASDMRFDQMDRVDIASKDRPDLLIFNRPFAFVEDQPPFSSSIVIIEFKRPLRNDYSDEDNPIHQVYGYIRSLKTGGQKTKDGRPIAIREGTPFYAYIICDITPTLSTQAENMGLVKTPDALGFFGYNSTLGAYVEMISFDKLIADSKKRNAVLFDKLGIRPAFEKRSAS
jgi:hypothetical protein